MVQPFISIIVPIYNVENYLSRCIESICNQTFTNFEVLLIDDGSTDNCPLICDSICLKDKRFSVIHKRNSGLPAARNSGINNAIGNYIIFLDSDDYIDPFLLEDLYNNYTKFSADIIVYGFSRINDKNIITTSEKPEINWNKELLLEKSEQLSFLLWNKAYSRNLFFNIDLQFIETLKFSEDSYLTAQLISKTNNVSFLNKSYYFWFIRTTSLSQIMSETKIQHQIFVAQELPNIINFPIEPYSCLVRKLKSKYFLINPDILCSKNEFKSNIKKWNNLFPEANYITSNIYDTNLMKIYLFFIKNYRKFFGLFGNIAFYLLHIRNSKKGN